MFPPPHNQITNLLNGEQQVFVKFVHFLNAVHGNVSEVLELRILLSLVVRISHLDAGMTRHTYQ